MHLEDSNSRLNLQLIANIKSLRHEKAYSLEVFDGGLIEMAFKDNAGI